MSGLILLILIAALVAFAWTRLRGKLKLPVNGKHWLGPIVIVAVLLWLLFASHSGH